MRALKVFGVRPRGNGCGRTRKLIGEVLGAAIILGASGVVATIVLASYSDQAQVMYSDLRSHLDLMRAQAVEQLDVTSREWRPGSNLTFFVVNYGDYESSYPFELYTEDGVDVTNEDVHYRDLRGGSLGECTPATNCMLYDMQLPPGGALVIEMPWPADDPLILVTDTGKGLWVGG